MYKMMTQGIITLGILGGQEILIIGIIILLLFGGKKLPELMKGLGKGIKEYKKTTSEIKDEINNNIKI